MTGHQRYRSPERREENYAPVRVLIKTLLAINVFGLIIIKRNGKMSQAPLRNASNKSLFNI